jgi:hypothetical protein
MAVEVEYIQGLKLRPMQILNNGHDLNDFHALENH